MAGGIYGLSGSGIDVDSVVKGLMKAQQTRYEAMQQKKTKLEWKKTDYNTLYTTMNNFRSTTVFNNKLQSNLAPKLVSSTNDQAVTATASAEAGSGSHSIEVTQLAEGVKQVSSSAITESGFKKGTLAEQFGVSGKFNVRIGNGTAAKDITVDSAGSINDFVSSINLAGVNVSASYDSNLDRFFFSTINSGEAATLNFSGSSSQGQDFITNKLKIPTKLNAVEATGITSGGPAFSNFSVNATLHDAFGIVGDDKGKFKLEIANGTNVKTLEFDPSKDTLNTFMDTINKAGIYATASYDSISGKFSLKAASGTLTFKGDDKNGAQLLFDKLKLPQKGIIDSIGVTSTDTLTPKISSVAALNVAFSDLPTSSFKLKINGEELSIDPSCTVQNFIAQLKTNDNVDASSDYDETTGILTLKAAAGKTLDFTGSDTAAIDLLSNKFKLDGLTKEKGQDSIINLDGMIGVHESSNVFTVSGVTYNLKAKTAVDSPANVVISSDVETIVKNVKSFVDEYNKVLKAVNAELYEKKYKDYLPLTEDQRTNMKEAEITTWETKAKSGSLRTDPILKSLVAAMRSDISTPISGLTGDYTSGTSIGFYTGPWEEEGKLYVNETKLRNALQADPTSVSRIFTTYQDGNNQSQNGIAMRLYDTLKGTADSIVKEAGATDSAKTDTTSNIAKQVDKYTKNMTEMNTRLKTLESNYYKKFNAMETALSKLNKQSTWLSQQTTSS